MPLAALVNNVYLLMKISILGNAVVDGFARVGEDVLRQHKLEKRGYNKLSAPQFFALCADVEVETYSAGGTAANVAHTLGQLGTDVIFMGRFGGDAAGQVFFDELVGAGVATQAPDASAKTMEVFVLITPDGQRTLVTLGTTAPMNDTWVRSDDIKNSDWLLVEGYVLSGQISAATYAMQIARDNDVKIALSLASESVLTVAAPALADTLTDGVDLIIGDTTETAALTTLLNKFPAAQTAFNKTARVTTHSGDGATFYAADGAPTFVATQKIDTPVDVTGAGDAFAAGFLAQFMAGENVADALTAGHTLAANVIMQIGGRIKDIT